MYALNMATLINSILFEANLLIVSDILSLEKNHKSIHSSQCFPMLNLSF